MELCIKETGKIIKLKGKENLYIHQEMFMKDNGKMIRLMVMVFTHIIIVKQNIKDNGLMIYSMGEVCKNIRTEIFIKENLRKEEGMEMENIVLKMEEIIKEIGFKEKCKEREFLVGQMVGIIKENG